MTPSQIFFTLMFLPLVFIGMVFGLTGSMVLFIPAYLVYKTHVNGWSVWQFFWRVTLASTVLLFACMLTFGG